jgi:5-methylcytosine-specific restriction protein A
VIELSRDDASPAVEPALCEWVTEGVRCTERATDVDHIRPGNNNNINTPRLLCAWHLQRRQEGNAARKRVTATSTQETHPGLIN